MAEAPIERQQSPAQSESAIAAPAAAIEASNEEAVAAFQAELGNGAPSAEEPSAPGDETPAAEADPPPTADNDSPAAPPTDDVQGEDVPLQPSDTPPQPETEDEAAAAAPGEPSAVALADIAIPVENAPTLAPAADADLAHQPDALENDSEQEDIETVAARRRLAQASARRKSQAAKARLPAIILVLAGVCVALIASRKDIVRHAPQMASLYAAIGLPVNLRGLIFTGVKIATETHDGVPVLVVEGAIVSTVSVPAKVPRLRFGLLNAAGTEVYAWTALPTQSVLEPGHKLPFRSRLASPPADGQDVQVRFFTRHDAVAGLR